jgi:hypothetical protein
MDLSRSDTEVAIILVASYAMNTGAIGRFSMDIEHKQPFGWFLASVMQGVA